MVWVGCVGYGTMGMAIRQRPTVVKTVKGPGAVCVQTSVPRHVIDAMVLHSRPSWRMAPIGGSPPPPPRGNTTAHGVNASSPGPTTVRRSRAAGRIETVVAHHLQVLAPGRVVGPSLARRGHGGGLVATAQTCTDQIWGRPPSPGVEPRERDATGPFRESCMVTKRAITPPARRPTDGRWRHRSRSTRRGHRTKSSNGKGCDRSGVIVGPTHRQRWS